MITEIAVHQGKSRVAVRQAVCRWSYDYLTATYFLLVTQKMKGKPIRLIQKVTPLGEIPVSLGEWLSVILIFFPFSLSICLAFRGVRSGYITQCVFVSDYWFCKFPRLLLHAYERPCMIKLPHCPFSRASKTSFQSQRTPARCLMEQLNKEKPVDVPCGMPNSLSNSPRGLHTSLEGGLDDIDLLSICKVTPIDQLVDKVVGMYSQWNDEGVGSVTSVSIVMFF